MSTVVRVKVTWPIILAVLVLFASCGGSGSHDRITTNPTGAPVDEFADLPKFGELPTDVVLHPSPLSADELEERKVAFRKSGDDFVACLQKRGWDVSLERNYPSYINFDPSAINLQAFPWPGKILADLRNPSVPAGNTGDITEDSTIDDAKSKIDYIENKLLRALRGDSRSDEVRPAFKNESEQKMYSTDVIECLQKGYTESSSHFQVPEKIQETVSKIKNDSEYLRLDDRKRFFECIAEKGFNPEANQVEQAIAPLRRWVESDIRPDFDAMHKFEIAQGLAWAECKYGSFRTQREIEIRYNREAGLI